MPLETIGFRAQIENLQGYLAGVNQISASNAKIAQSELRVQAVSQQTAVAQVGALKSVTDAERNLSVVTRQASRAYINAKRNLAVVTGSVASQITEAEIAVGLAQARVAKSATASAVKQEAAAIRLAKTERTLENVQVAGAAKIAAAQEVVANAYTTKVERISAAEAVVQAATARSVAVAQANAIKQTQAQIALASVNARAAASAVATTAAASGSAAGFNLVTASMGALRLAARGAEAATNIFGRALIAITGFSNRFAVSIRFGALAIGAFTTALTIKEASEFENILARIDVLTEATAEEVALLSKELKTLAETIPKSPDELGTANYFVLSSGIKDVNEALEITEIAAKAATIGLGTTEEVARVITATINAYGKENISAAQATDILVAAIQQGSAEAPDFVAGLGRLLGIAPALGIEFDELASAIAALTNVGLPARQATTALLGILNQLVKNAPEARETLAQVGLSIQDLRQQIDEEGLIPALQNMLTAFGNNQNAIEALFPEVRGLTGALLLLRDESKAYDEILAAVANSSGITEEGFARMSETFSFQAGLLKNQLNLFLIQLGETILPSVTAAVQDLIGWVDRNKEAIIEWTVSIGTLVATILGGFLKGISVILSAMDSIVSKKTAVIGTFVAIGVAILTNLGPKSRAGIALFLIATLVGRIANIKADQSFAESLGFAGEEAEKLNQLLEKLEKRQTEQPRVNFSSPEFIRKELEKNLEAIPVGTTIDEITAGIGERLAEIRREQATADQLATQAAEASKRALEEIERAYADQEVAADKLKTALQDASISFEEAAELGLTAIEAGALEAAAAADKAAKSAFDFEKALSRVANAFSTSIDAARGFALDLSRNALDSVRDASSALFSRPTREIADLEVSLAQLQIANLSAINGLDAQTESLDSSTESLDKYIESLQEQLDLLDQGPDKIDEINNKIRELLGIETAAPNAITPPTPFIVPQNILIPGAILTEAEQEILRLVQERETEIKKREIQRQIDAAEAEKERIAEQKEAIQQQIDSIRNSEEAIQRQIDLYTLQNEAAQKQIDAADQTLLTQEELATKAGEVAREMFEQSGAVRTLSDLLEMDLIPEMDLMREAVILANDALRVLEDTDFREIFLAYENQLKTIAEQQEVALQEIFTPLNTEVETLKENMKALNKAFSEGPFAQFLEQPELSPTGEPILGQQHGGLITKPTTTLRGEHNLPELVLPLGEPSRSRELLMSLPPSIAAQIGLGRGGSPTIQSLFGDFSVQGIITPEIEHMVQREVRRQLNRPRAGLRAIGL